MNLFDVLLLLNSSIFLSEYKYKVLLSNYFFLTFFFFFCINILNKLQVLLFRLLIIRVLENLAAHYINLKIIKLLFKFLFKNYSFLKVEMKCIIKLND